MYGHNNNNATSGSRSSLVVKRPNIGKISRCEILNLMRVKSAHMGGQMILRWIEEPVHLADLCSPHFLAFIQIMTMVIGPNKNLTFTVTFRRHHPVWQHKRCCAAHWRPSAGRAILGPRRSSHSSCESCETSIETLSNSESATEGTGPKERTRSRSESRGQAPHLARTSLPGPPGPPLI